MNNHTVFDVLIVYTDGIATSASSAKEEIKPFSIKSEREQYNESYSYFLNYCHKKGLKVGFTTSGDLSNDRTFRAYWLYKKGKWIKVKKSCYAPIIFDKFSPINSLQKYRRKLLFDNYKVTSFNSLKIFDTFFDKQKTYNDLTIYSIPTVTLDRQKPDFIKKAVIKLENLIEMHPNKTDFSKKIIIKDRYGSGGNYIYCTKNEDRKKMIKEIVSKYQSISFILQPFAHFGKGIKNLKNQGFSDMRLIFLGNKIVQSYIRTADNNNFLCNTHQGGKIEYIEINKIPLKIKKAAKQVVNALGNDNGLFALDFIISNNGNSYLLEGNSGPGLNWDKKLDGDEVNTKKLIRIIVNELSNRVLQKRTLNHADKIWPLEAKIPLVV